MSYYPHNHATQPLYCNDSCYGNPASTINNYGGSIDHDDYDTGCCHETENTASFCGNNACIGKSGRTFCPAIWAVLIISLIMYLSR